MMASASDVEIVRNYTNELDNTDPFTNDVLSTLIDSLGIAGASADVWRQKAARLSAAVDVTEAGASHKLSDMHKTALSFVKYWEVRAGEVVPTPEGVGTKVKRIVRT